MIRCAACGTLNRVPQEKLDQGLAPVCGKCQAPLPAPAVLTVTDATFSDQVEKSKLPVLVDLWAEWCGPCKMIAPALEQIAREMRGKLRVAKVNVDDNPVTAQRFDVRSIPLLVVMKDGREVDRLVGAQPKSAILNRLQSILS
ncbi:MAG TPA: thioredoxin TrxC [Bryobacteraceae bacterium]|nr:thioredoxin TrxC [Bryobacteraceae bacterium]